MLPTQSSSAPRPLRVVVVGAGPAGIYATEALVGQNDVPVTVDLIDRLPTPFGLVRYGIAPDHQKMRAIRETLHRTLDHPMVRFLGNVNVGVDVSTDELRTCADAVVYTYGASRDRRLGIEGEDLPGCLAAIDLVNWYCGHPDADRDAVEQALARARSVIVVGVGNVALDIARVLLRDASELEPTDMPQHVLDALDAAPVTDVTVIGRRGPVQASFTTQELRGLGALSRAAVLVDATDLPAHDEGTAPTVDRAVARNMAVLRGWVANEPAAGIARLTLRFYQRPARVLGDERVTGLEVERTAVDGAGRAFGTGELSVLPADLIVRSIGYLGCPLPGLPIDEASGTVPNAAGRILRDGSPSPGEYVAGWIKRGPTGVVGTNKHDARESVGSLLRDVAAGLVHSGRPLQDLLNILVQRGVEPVQLSGWRAIDSAEIALGMGRGRGRTTIHERADLLVAVRASNSD